MEIWINDKLNEKDWSQRELARQAGIAHTTVSKVLGGQVEPTWDFCAAIARAFGERPETVLRIAGLLPASGGKVEDLSPEEGEIINLWRSVPSVASKELMMQLLRAWAKGENEGV